MHLKVDTGMHRVGCTPRRCRRAGAPRRPPGPARARGRVHPPRGGRRARRRLHRRAARSLRRGARRARRRGPAPAGRARGELGRDARAPPRRATPSCASASRCTGCPGPALHGHGGVELRPVMSLRARVTMVKELPAGEGLSYGLRYELDHRAASPPCRRVRRRCAPQPGVAGRRGAHRRPAPARSRASSPWTSCSSTSATRRWRRATKWCSSGGRATRRSPPPSGHSTSAPSTTRSSPGSGRGAPCFYCFGLIGPGLAGRYG